uniref:Uncharacterized protein n=1 Tax=Meloidogyne enterolobii TaxID=390850 RepID=A0A6V7XL95_MELEN|nr:unnamed protein product [Meloidogyne enterolobii]
MSNFVPTASSDFYFIRSNVDLNTVKPMGTGDLVRIFNDFLVTSTNLLDSFCSKFEDNVIALEARIDSVERYLLLLEHKLAHVSLDATQDVCYVETKDENEKSTNFDELLDLNENQQLSESLKTKEDHQPDEPLKNNRENETKAKDHPVFGKYFRMLKMGVPEAAVKQKMQSEGVDPEILSVPDKIFNTN